MVLEFTGKARTQYVALGSSFASGIGLGPRVPGSPRLCMRCINSYPQQLARLIGVSLTDTTCAGARTAHVLRGGQYFQKPQLEALDADTELVTLTAGGNDVRYGADLSLLAARHRQDIIGWLLRRFWRGPLGQRNWTGLHSNLLGIIREIRCHSPKARVIVVTYPTILPPDGTCSGLGLTGAEAEVMRQVGARLAEVTRAAVLEAGAEFLDMAALSADHHACSAVPWVHGGQTAAGAQFHPSKAGAKATAMAIARHLGHMG